MAMHRRKPHPNEFTVIGAFVLAGTLSLVVGGTALLLLSRQEVFTSLTPQLEPRKAPTVAEYRAEARTVLSPFLEQAANMTEEDIGSGDAIVLGLVEKTQERLLNMIVPADERDAHLAFVLLLDQWKRALKGSAADIARVGDSTSGTVDAYPWVLDEPSST